MKRGLLKSFRDYLNKKYPLELGRHKNFKYHQRIRLYGDYLYQQDRVMFNVYLTQALNGEEEFLDWKREIIFSSQK